MKDDNFTLCLIVAVAENGVIGLEGKLPWRIPSDLRRFRKSTMGHPVLMGRKTFESIGKPLDGRDSIVVTRNPESLSGARAENVLAVSSLNDALSQARACAERRGVRQAFVIGGAEFFSQTLPLASRLYLTLVHAAPRGDVHWPLPSSEEWREIERKNYPASERDEFAVTDLTLERLKGA